MPCHPSYSGSIKDDGLGPPRHKLKTLLENITEAKRAGAVAQVVEHLPSKLKA
jgi:hypothetical protein